MKVLMVNKFLYPNGGSETYIFQIGKQLEKMGHKVQYFGMEDDRRIVGNEVNSYTSNINFHTGKISRLLYPFKIIYSVEARKKIRLVLNDFAPDVVHLNNFNFQLTPSIIYEIEKYRRQSGKKVRLVFTAHDFQLLCPNHMLRIPFSNQNCEKCLEGNLRQCTKNKCIHNSLVKSLLGEWEGKLYRKLKTYRYLDTIICPSYFMEKKFLTNSLYKGKTMVMHNFVDASRAEIPDKKGYVLYFGRYSEEKGIRTLVSVCKRLPEIPFVFAGSGPLENEMNQVDNIKNAGFLKGAALRKVIEEADFSVYPSEWYENCPFSVMESIAYGTPVLGADIGGIPELIRVGETGELFKSGDGDDLYRKMKKMWDNKKISQDYSEKCREKNFDTVQEYCEKLIWLYQKN
ncbi:glycosyltransferase [bacterium 1xD42-62]|uniref:Glycosyltransferase n=2 Tax=Parablautia muri TaxID=2320879 RepID=A0A9X5GQP5_9FIRM|nr:glycosyltransferase [Parablautia muri]NBJ91316.1 glycosyltransferase [Parablautia muri]